MNGKHLSRELIHSSITDMIIAGDHLIFGNMSGVVVIKEINGFVTFSICLYSMFHSNWQSVELASCACYDLALHGVRAS